MEDKILPKIIAFWNDVFPNTIESNAEITDFTRHFPMLKLAEQSRIFFTVLKTQNLHLEYYSKNTEDVLGIPLDVFEEKKINAFYEVVAPEHLEGVMTSFKHAGLYYNALKNKKDVTENMIYRCGLKLNHPKKGQIKLFWRSQVFEMLNDFNNPQRILLMMQDVTHLIKGDFFWFRAELKDGAETSYFTSRSDTEGCSKNDILSDREKEILTCFAEGKSPEEVSKQLFISKVTVNNHRQNMLNKMGAKDLTALIQLSKMMKMI